MKTKLLKKIKKRFVYKWSKKEQSYAIIDLKSPIEIIECYTTKDAICIMMRRIMKRLIVPTGLDAWLLKREEDI